MTDNKITLVEIEAALLRYDKEIETWEIVEGIIPSYESNYPCIIESFFRNNPNEKIACIFCQCPRCSPWYC